MSLLGDQVSVLAIPLTAILVLHAGAVQLGLLTAMSLLFSAAGHAGRRYAGHPVMGSLGGIALTAGSQAEHR